GSADEDEGSSREERWAGALGVGRVTYIEEGEHSSTRRQKLEGAKEHAQGDRQGILDVVSHWPPTVIEGDERRRGIVEAEEKMLIFRQRCNGGDRLEAFRASTRVVVLLLIGVGVAVVKLEDFGGDVNLEPMTMNLKERSRCVVNRGEDLTAVDFNNDVQLSWEGSCCVVNCGENLTAVDFDGNVSLVSDLEIRTKKTRAQEERALTARGPKARRGGPTTAADKAEVALFLLHYGRRRWQH
ncbi:hypothetical protein GW17_00049982, partial [Ensete ventricosum]